MRTKLIASFIGVVALGTAAAAQAPPAPRPPAAPAAPAAPAPPARPLPALPAPRASRPPDLRRAPAAQRRGPEETERFSRTLKLAKDGSVSIANISGEIAVTGGSGDEVSIEAVKRTPRDNAQLAAVQISVEERAGRIDVKTEYPRLANVNVSVDYTVTVPTWAAVELRSVSGSIRIAGVQGAARAQSVSGAISASDTPKLELASSVSGSIDIAQAAGSDDLDLRSVSGAVRARGVKASNLNVSTVSGDVTLSDVSCTRLDANSVSGRMDYSGALAKAGRYRLTSHSGSVHVAVGPGSGFELDASTFSGSIDSEMRLVLTGSLRTGGARNSPLHATFGDGSAALSIRTFSGNVVISRR